jgi:hypothetical protein
MDPSSLSRMLSALATTAEGKLEVALGNQPSQWLAFCGQAHAAGSEAVFAYPLRIVSA